MRGKHDQKGFSAVGFLFSDSLLGLDQAALDEVKNGNLFRQNLVNLLNPP
jgi:hypothetical protein